MTLGKLRKGLELYQIVFNVKMTMRNCPVETTVTDRNSEPVISFTRDNLFTFDRHVTE